MSNEMEKMEVDAVPEKAQPPQKPMVVSRAGLTILASPQPSPGLVFSISSANQARVIQAVPTTVTSGGKAQKLQIVRLVTPSQQQRVLKTQGAPVRIVTTGTPGGAPKIQIAPMQTVVSAVSQQPQRVATSQRLILPASARRTTTSQTVLTTGTTLFTSPSGGPQQVLAILSPQKTNTGPLVNQSVRVIAHNMVSPNSTAARSYVVSATNNDQKSEPISVKKEPLVETNQRKPCNCTKSHCLKLYCDCFAKGEFCSNCNCIGCANILSQEEQRQKAIKQCLLRNPHAFHPKIGKGESAEVRRHQKGCNCKRSGCLKNYCECFEARIMCGSTCKCVGCKNCEENSTGVSLMRLADAAMVRTMQQQNSTSDKLSLPHHQRASTTVANKNRESLKSHLTSSVIEGVLDCVLSQCREAEGAKCKPDTTQKLILEEFGRCVTKIIQSSASDGI